MTVRVPDVPTPHIDFNMSAINKLDDIDLSALNKLDDVDISALKNLDDVDISALKNLDDVDISALNKLDNVELSNPKRLDGDAADLNTKTKAEPEPSSFIKNNKGKLATAGVLGALGIGAAIAIDKDNKDVNAARRQCAEVCMPTCWDCNKYPDQVTACDENDNPDGCSKCKKQDGTCTPMEKNSLDNLTKILGKVPDEIGGKSWSKQPWCDPSDPNCPTWCLDSCKDIHPKFTERAKDFLQAPFNALGGWFDEWSDTTQQAVFWVLVVGGILLFSTIIYKTFFKKKTVVQSVNSSNSL